MALIKLRATPMNSVRANPVISEPDAKLELPRIYGLVIALLLAQQSPGLAETAARAAQAAPAEAE